MSDIDEIRKKHEAQMEYTKSKQGDAPYLFQSIHSNLSISDVDALLAALDARNDLLTLCEKQRDKTVEKNDELKAALDEARGKVAAVRNWRDEHLDGYKYCYELPIEAKNELEQILKGGE